MDLKTLVNVCASITQKEMSLLAMVGRERRWEVASSVFSMVIHGSIKEEGKMRLPLAITLADRQLSCTLSPGRAANPP